MNKINPVKINSVVQEISSKKEVIKETAKEVVKEVKTQASNLGRDLVASVEKDSPNITASELLQEGYKPGYMNVFYKVDNKKDIYDAVQYGAKGVENITMSGAIMSEKSVVTQRLGDYWGSISKGDTVQYNKLENTSERAAKKATQLQFDGYSIVAQDNKSLTFAKDNSSINIDKSNGKEIK